MQLPGPGTIYMRQSLNFLAPVRFGDTITAKVEVVEVIAEKNRVRLKTTCTNQEGTVVLDGEAMVIPPKAKT
jgi:3-hydroxybutyryl-CoA dehydratase